MYIFNQNTLKEQIKPGDKNIIGFTKNNREFRFDP